MDRAAAVVGDNEVDADGDDEDGEEDDEAEEDTAAAAAVVVVRFVACDVACCGRFGGACCRKAAMKEERKKGRCEGIFASFFSVYILCAGLVLSLARWESLGGVLLIGGGGDGRAMSPQNDRRDILEEPGAENGIVAANKKTWCLFQ